MAVKLSEANKAKNVEDEALSDDLQLDEDDPCEPPKSKGKKARQDSDEYLVTKLSFIGSFANNPARLDLVSVVQEYQRRPFCIQTFTASSDECYIRTEKLQGKDAQRCVPQEEGRALYSCSC